LTFHSFHFFPFVLVIFEFLGFFEMKMRREMRAKYAVFTRWNNFTKALIPLKLKLKQRVAEMELNCKHRLMRSVLLGFHSGTIGKESKKVAMKERKELIESIRQEMSDQLRSKGEIGIVLEEDVHTAVERRVCMDYIASKKRRDKGMVFNGFKKFMKMFKNSCRMADGLRFKKLAGKCFYNWSDHTYMVSVGLDRQVCAYSLYCVP